MSKLEQRRKDIFRHGVNLITIFGLQETEIGPEELYRRLRQLEQAGDRNNVRYCNGEIDDVAWEKQSRAVRRRVNDLLGFESKGIPVIMNGDPRGYCLKIDDAYVREHRLAIRSDFGGYGILAPSFD